MLVYHAYLEENDLILKITHYNILKLQTKEYSPKDYANKAFLIFHLPQPHDEETSRDWQVTTEITSSGETR